MVTGLAVFAVAVGLVIWYTTRLASVQITNDTPTAVHISSCGNDVLEIDPGTTTTEQVPTGESRLGCDVYSATSNKYLGCLNLTRSGRLVHSVDISETRQDIAQDSC